MEAKRKIKIFLTRYKWQVVGAMLLMLSYWFCLPRHLFENPTCVVVEDSTGGLLGARIAADGQWRFPHNELVPEKFENAIIAFEDRRFYYHFGIDLLSLGRAIQQNVSHRRTVSGGSTITMQIIRMAKKNPHRTVWNKLIEMILATRLELRHSKKEILALYASNAPFGGNVVGLETAAWRYFSKSPNLLSWAEAATLAVLPNSPALIHPGRNRETLLKKRNKLLLKLLENQTIDTISYELALEEEIPEQPAALPQLAPHLLDRVCSLQLQQSQTRFQTTIDVRLQIQLTHLLNRHHHILQNNYIHNAAAVVIDVETGAVLAYVGNVVGAGQAHGEQVDIISAPRSTGSIIKPLLYAAVLDEGLIHPNTLLPDIPMQLSGYRPENFLQRYDGVVKSERALSRSLNAPIIRMLQMYGLEKFHYRLQQLGFSTINQPANHYGLPLVLGGAEVTLEQITSTYASMARTLKHFPIQNGWYHPNDFRMAHVLYEKNEPKARLQKSPIQYSAAAIWFAFDAMQTLERPSTVGEWERFDSSRKIAWKTGTSFGFRDAWAVGVDTKYAVGVWVGNADGEGRPGLVGVHTAAPIMFDIFHLLPAASAWFEAPYDEMIELPICKQSGFRALDICEKDTFWALASHLKMSACPYHQVIHLDSSLNWQVNSNCELVSNIQHQPWFVLPPVEAHYYKGKNPSYKALPPFRGDCEVDASQKMMELIYPKMHAKIYVPVDIDGNLSSTVFRAAHRKETATVHWHLDEHYLGSTQHFHEIELQPVPGVHQLTLVDDSGQRLEQTFTILAK